MLKIGVLALSSCLINAEWPDCNGRPCSKVEAIRPYKIHLAFENGDSPGFVTDKYTMLSKLEYYQCGWEPEWTMGHGSLKLMGQMGHGSRLCDP